MTDFYKLVPNAPEGRFDGIERPYSAEDVKRLRGSVEIRYSLAEMGANRPGSSLRGGLRQRTRRAFRQSGDADGARRLEGDLSLRLAGCSRRQHRFGHVSGPVALSGQRGSGTRQAHQRTLQRADQIETAEGKGLSVETWFAPIVADAEAGFGGPLNAFEIMKAFIEAGAAGVHYEDQLASEKKCGHLGGKVLIPTAAHIRNLNAARLAADVMGTPTLVIARTDAEAAKLLTSDIDERDRPFVDYDAGRTVEGFYQVKNGIEPCIARAIAYAPHCDLIWCETSKPDLEQARKFAEGVHKAHPGKLLAYNCSPSFNWKKNLDDATIAKFQRELGAMGYKFQFITLAGFHQLNYGMFELARGYRDRQMAAYSELQEAEFAAEANGYTATKHRAKWARLFRCRVGRDHRRPVVDHCHEGIHRARSVPPGSRMNERDARHPCPAARPQPDLETEAGINEVPRDIAQRSTPMTVQTRVKERAEEQSSAMTPEQQAAIRMVANDLHRLNQAVMKAVDAGVSVELVRSARHHGGDGNWGDLLIPVIVTQGRH